MCRRNLRVWTERILHQFTNYCGFISSLSNTSNTKSNYLSHSYYVWIGSVFVAMAMANKAINRCTCFTWTKRIFICSNICATKTLHRFPISYCTLCACRCAIVCLNIAEFVASELPVIYISAHRLNQTGDQIASRCTRIHTHTHIPHLVRFIVGATVVPCWFHN